MKQTTCLQKKILTVTVLASLMVMLSSCNFYYLSLLDQFKEYMENISVSSMVLDDTYPEDSDGIVCIPSGAARSATVYILNPLALPVDTTVSLPSPALTLASAAGIDTSNQSNMYSISQSSDKTYITLTYTDTFLTAIDGNSSLVSEGVRQNDITPTFTFAYSDDATKTFGPFTPLAVRCNSTPSLVTDSVIMEKGPDGSAKTYVVFFNMPETTGTQKDIVTLTITSDGTPTSFTVTPTGTSTKTKLTAADNGTSGLYASWNTATQGILTNANGATVSEKAYPVYFVTGIASDSNEHTFIITLTDTMALSSSTTASNRAPILNEATCSTSDTTISQDEGSAYATVTWTAPSEAHYVGDDGVTQTKAVEQSSVQLKFSLYNGHDASPLTATPLATTTSYGSYSTTIPHGDYTVVVVASLGGFIASTATKNITVTQTTAYVDAHAAQTTLCNGSKENPYTTITLAVSNMTDISNVKNKVILCSDITETVLLDNKTLTVASEDTTSPHTITGSTAETFTLTTGSLTLSDVIVTGATASSTAVFVGTSSTFAISGKTTVSRVHLATLTYISINGALSSTAATDSDISTPVAVIIPETYVSNTFTTPLIKTSEGTMSNSICDMFIVENDSNNNSYFIVSGTDKSDASDDEKQFGYLQKLEQSVSYSQTNGLNGNAKDARVYFICDANDTVTYTLTLPRGYTVDASTESGTLIVPETTASTYTSTFIYTLPKAVTSTMATFILIDSNNTTTTYEFIYGGVAVGTNTTGIETGTALHPFTDIVNAYSAFNNVTHTATIDNNTTSFDILYLVSDITLTNEVSLTPTIPFTISSSANGTAITQKVPNKRIFTIDTSLCSYMTLRGIMLTGCSLSSENGAVYLKGGVLNMDGVNITANSAPNGSGVFITDGTLNLYSTSAITNNTATSNGGGIYMEGGTLTISDSATVCGNNAVNGGGLYITGGTAQLTTGAINGNNASSFGTQLYLHSGNVEVGGAATLLNVATNDETHPGVYLETGSMITITSSLTTTGTSFILQPEMYPIAAPITVVQGTATTPLAEADLAHILAANDSNGNKWSINNAGQLYRSATITVTVASGLATTTFTTINNTITKGSSVTISATNNNQEVDAAKLTVMLNGTTLSSTPNTTLAGATYSNGTLTVPTKPGVYALTISFQSDGITYSSQSTLTVIQ